MLTDVSKLLLAGSIADHSTVVIGGNVDGTLEYVVSAPAAAAAEGEGAGGGGGGEVVRHRSKPIRIEEGSGNKAGKQGRGGGNRRGRDDTSM
eukprot:SAG22_NODE_263_length_13359_cov_3.396531_2_plen_92_part_00